MTTSTTAASRVAFDSPVSEIHAENSVVAEHRRAYVGRAGSKLRIDNAFTFARIAVFKIEYAVVYEGNQAVGIIASRIRMHAAELNQRIQLLDGRKAPIFVTSHAATISTLNSSPIVHLVARIFGPHESGDQIGYGPVTVVLVAGAISKILCVLAVEGLAVCGKCNVGLVIKCVLLIGVDDRIAEVFLCPVNHC